ncbi:RICIN domain-containing protein [Hymenobacter terrenus]|uniref:RICIN domain-containing protein n=1 Tax=Hymenobacter terrenus TaxID=1629124 RepID=UPI00373FDD78
MLTQTASKRYLGIIGIRGGSLANGEKATVSISTGRQSTWVLQYNYPYNSEYQFVNQFSGKSLDISNGTTSPGEPFQQWSAPYPSPRWMSFKFTPTTL